jgi:queuine tRNA-ribosyltransferase
MNGFSFDITHTDTHSRTRCGCIHTPHGDIETPAFVPVGTQCGVKSLTSTDVSDLDVHLFFVNTYHAFLRPGLEVIKEAGGLHGFMGWERPLITDSGGFQVFSLANRRFATKNEEGKGEASLVKIHDDGVTFRSHWDGSLHEFTPESSMEYQWTLGSDIHIAFDDCTAYPVTRKGAQQSMERTHRWAVRSLTEHKKLTADSRKRKAPYQALYGSIQGSIFEDLRIESAKFISSLDVDGIAIGGVSVGESKAEMKQVLEWVTPHLPELKPRHLLGVGEIDDIFTLIEYGIDTFDCVQPTRLARMGTLFTQDSQNQPGYSFDITKSSYAQDFSPIEKDCSCFTCTHTTRAYLHHLFKVRELAAYRYATIHNIHFINTLVSEIRQSIRNGTFLELKQKFLYHGK